MAPVWPVVAALRYQFSASSSAPQQVAEGEHGVGVADLGSTAVPVLASVAEKFEFASGIDSASSRTGVAVVDEVLLGAAVKLVESEADSVGRNQ